MNLISTNANNVEVVITTIWATSIFSTAHALGITLNDDTNAIVMGKFAVIRRYVLVKSGSEGVRGEKLWV